MYATLYKTETSDSTFGSNKHGTKVYFISLMIRPIVLFRENLRKTFGSKVREIKHFPSSHVSSPLKFHSYASVLRFYQR